MVLGLAGCRHATSPDLRVEKNTLDSIHPEAKPHVIKDLGSNTKIVTGVPATVGDKNDPTAQEPKYKSGAVAVKMDY